MKNHFCIIGLISVVSLNSCQNDGPILTKKPNQISYDSIQESSKEILVDETQEIVLETPTFDLNKYISLDANELLTNKAYLNKLNLLLGNEAFKEIKRNMIYCGGNVQEVNDSTAGKCIFITGYDERNEGSLYEGIFMTDESMNKVWAAATTEGAITLQYPQVKGNEDALPEVYKKWVNDHTMND
jgi:hypothetical protein